MPVFLSLESVLDEEVRSNPSEAGRKGSRRKTEIKCGRRHLAEMHNGGSQEEEMQTARRRERANVE